MASNRRQPTPSPEAARGSEEQFRAFFEAMDQGYILVDVLVDQNDAVLDLLYVEANSAAVRMTGTELVGRRTRELSPDYESHWFETFARVARTGVGERHEFSAGPLAAWYDVYVFKVGAPATRRVAAVYQDITSRKNADVALRESAVRQAFLLALADTIRPLSDPVAIQKAATRLLGDHLETARAFYGEWNDDDGTCVVQSVYLRDDASSVAGVYRVDDFAPLGDVLRVGDNFVVDDLLDSPAISAEVGARFQSFGVRSQIAVPLLKHGRLMATLMVNQSSPRAWTPFEVSLVQETAERTWAAVARARTEAALRASEDQLRRAHDELETRVENRTAELGRANAALEDELRERRAAEEQISALLVQLVTIQEEERRRFSRDVHDQLGQQMTALRMNLDALQMRAIPQPALAGPIGTAWKLAAQLDQSIDFLTWQLRPPVLEHLGLADALGHFVSGWSYRFNVAADYKAPIVAGPRLAPGVETNLYRLAQEALHNVFKHAGASRVSVRFEQGDGGALLVIADNGRGFDLAAVPRDAATRCLGLASMRERAALVGGALEIETAMGRGTIVTVRVPANASSARSGVAQPAL